MIVAGKAQGTIPTIAGSIRTREIHVEIEVGEGRPGIKENIAKSNTQPAQSGASVSQGLSGVRQRARERKQEKFTALLHHLTVDLLRESYFALQRKAAPGIDGETWQQ